MYDGSGLSRYNYVTADAIVALLKHVWEDETLRGPFVAALPVGGHDGTLETRMRGTILDRRVQAKTGTISNMRALSGYLETTSGERSSSRSSRITSRRRTPRSTRSSRRRSRGSSETVAGARWPATTVTQKSTTRRTRDRDTWHHGFPKGIRASGPPCCPCEEGSG